MQRRAGERPPPPRGAGLCGVVYEQGLEARLEPDGLWRLQSAPDGGLVPSLQRVTEAFGVRPVVRYVRSEYMEDACLCSASGEGRLELAVSGLLAAASQLGTSPMATWLHRRLMPVVHVLLAVVHHCKLLAEHYAEVCRLFARSPPPEGGNVCGLWGLYGPAHETEALVTEARRAYDSLRHVIWRPHGHRGTCPNSFPRTLQNAGDLPAVLRERLEGSWARYGERLTEYRHCIQHYIPVCLYHGYQPCMNMRRLAGGVWATSLYLPDNPEVHSAAKFTYAEELDALSWCWAVTSEVVEIARVVKDSILQRATEAGS